MPRASRIVLSDVPYHLTQRGVNRQDVFRADDEYTLYLTFLRRFAKVHGLSILGYCLMTNHVHLIGLPHQETALARVLGFTHSRYAQVTNPRHQRVGHLWQGRFYACPLDEAHLVRALRYVERNPVRADMVTCPWEYPWSSARAHCTGDDPMGLLDIAAWHTQWPGDSWQQYLWESEMEDDLQELRYGTRTGRPLGDESFITGLEARAGRRLHPLAVGRPRKAETSADE